MMTHPSPSIAIIGAGPAGLMAAEWLALAGCRVTIYDRMPSPARKFLLAGRGGLNLTHVEPIQRFLQRYGVEAERLAPALAMLDNTDVQNWAADLGQPTFVGSSGRVFPRSFKASPLLRAWLQRLDALGVTLVQRARWIGWSDDGIAIHRENGATETVASDAILLAMGGASWPRMGSDGGWIPVLRASGITVSAFVPANAGLKIHWSEPMRRFAGQPLKRIALGVLPRGSPDATEPAHAARGEAIVTEKGLEGGAVYGVFRMAREMLTRGGADLLIDLRTDLTTASLAGRIAAQPPKASLSTRLKRAGLTPAAISLMRDARGGALPTDPFELAGLAKAVRLPVIATEDIDRAISSAGGVSWDEIDADFMLKRRPGTFVAGEMIDWEAPTGGYLLQAAFATGCAAAQGILRRLGLPVAPPSWWRRGNGEKATAARDLDHD